MRVANMPHVTWDRVKNRAVYQRRFPKDVVPLTGQWFRFKYPSSFSKRQADAISFEQTAVFTAMVDEARQRMGTLDGRLDAARNTIEPRLAAWRDDLAARQQSLDGLKAAHANLAKRVQMVKLARELGIEVPLPTSAPSIPVDTEAVITAWVNRNRNDGKPPKPQAIASKRNKMALFLNTVRKAHMGEVIEADGKRYLRHLEAKAAEENKPSLPNDHISELKTLFGVAHDRDMLNGKPDPFRDIKVPQRQRDKRPPFSDDEARQILSAARQSDDPVIRWGNWIAAHTTCINSEVLEAQASEFYQLSTGQWVWDMRGRKLKTGFRPRMMPLHDAIIAEGFLDYLAGRKGKALFDGNPEPNSNRLNRWLKEHTEKSFYSWRHRVIHMLDNRIKIDGHRFDPKLSRYVSGHKAKDIHEAFYNHHAELMDELADEWNEIVAYVSAMRH